MKIFLSHSSKDKDIVKLVYDEIGHALCHYDVATFDPTSFLPEQIYTALSESTHFVLFASESALSSHWVQGELRTAFLNWMQAGIQDVTVFLLRDGKRSDVPDWLQSYVIVEHPTPRHIAARIRSKIAEHERKSGLTPPFYRWPDLEILEKSIVVQASELPKAIMICAPDGYGRKQLINELYSRHFNSVSEYKLSIFMEECDSEVDLYKAVIGSLSLISISQLSESLREFEIMDVEDRYNTLARAISKLCSGNQILILDSKDELLDDFGEISQWLIGLIHSLPRTDYPRLVLLSKRHPTYIRRELIGALALQQLEPINFDSSKTLLMWWLKKLDTSLDDVAVDNALEYVEGSNKQIELAARLFAANPEYLKVKRRIFSNLEEQASEILHTINGRNACQLVLAFIADCGHISGSDLLFALQDAEGISHEEFEEAIGQLIAYGFVLNDTVSMRLPIFLVRPARKLGMEPAIKDAISIAWKNLLRLFENLSDHAESSISLLSEASVAHLKSGCNKIPLVDSIILPSQCYKMARRYYDKRKYKQALELCNKAYQRRLALTKDGEIEVLRIQGLSASRLNDQGTFTNVISLLGEYGTYKKALRIRNFLLGFNLRLDGKIDSALTHMLEAYTKGGGGDFHILRELASLTLAQDNIEGAKQYVKKAKSYAYANSFILEMEIKIELSWGKGHVQANEEKILALIEGLKESEKNTHGNFSRLINIDYKLTIGNKDEAYKLISCYDEKDKRHSVQILRARVLIAKKRFSEARTLLLELKKVVSNNTENQRKSVLPLVARLLIDASSGISVEEGISEFKYNNMMLPLKIRDKIKNEFQSAIRFGNTNLSKDLRCTIGL